MAGKVGVTFYETALLKRVRLLTPLLSTRYRPRPRSHHCDIRRVERRVVLSSVSFFVCVCPEPVLAIQHLSDSEPDHFISDLQLAIGISAYFGSVFAD